MQARDEQAQLLAAIREAKVEVESNLAKLPEPEKVLSPAQLRVWSDTAGIICLLCGRRAGKTVFAAVWLLLGALSKSESLSIYLALSKASARNIVWPAMRDACRLLGIPLTVLHEHTLTVKLPNGSIILCAGTDDVRTIESWRGTKLWRAVVDEMGSQPDSFLRYVVEDILEPALLDLRGRLLLCGTPALICKGYWYDLTGPERRTRQPVHHFTVFDNPFIPHAAEEVARIKRDRGWDDNTPSYKREWLAEWVNDVGSLVFPIDQDGGNDLDAFPKTSSAGGPLDPYGWRFVIGVDVGIVDATAIVLVASHRDDDREIIVHSEAHGEWLPKQLAYRLREIFSELAELSGDPHRTVCPVVLDTGGMGKVHAEELSRTFAIHVIAAEKREKESAIRFTRDKLLARRIQILVGKCNDPLREEWSGLGWDEDRRLPNPNLPDHVSDATSYALRYLRHYQQAANGPAPEPGSLAARRAHEATMESERMRRSGRLSARMYARAR